MTREDDLLAVPQAVICTGHQCGGGSGKTNAVVAGSNILSWGKSAEQET